MLIQKMLHLDRVRVHKSWKDMVTAVLSLALIASLFWQPTTQTTNAKSLKIPIGAKMPVGFSVFTVLLCVIIFFTLRTPLGV